MGPLTVAVAGPALVTDRSVCSADTEVVADAELLAGTGSDSLPETVAVLLSWAAVDGVVTVMVNVALAPTARLPTGQVTVPALLVQPGADTKVTPEGRVSVTVTPVAGSGPLFLATT